MDENKKKAGTSSRLGKELIAYLIVGVLTTVVSLSVYYLCVTTVFDPGDPLLLQAANVISWIAAVIFAYVANRRFVFESRDPDIVREAASFFTARIGTLLMDMGIMFVCVTLLSVNDKAAKLLAQVVVTASNYIFSKLFVFRGN